VPLLARRVESLLLLCCTTLALANLPAKDLPLGWLLAFTLPGAVLGMLRKPVKGNGTARCWPSCCRRRPAYVAPEDRRADDAPRRAGLYDPAPARYS
jgi:hypothetical protein